MFPLKSSFLSVRVTTYPPMFGQLLSLDGSVMINELSHDDYDLVELNKFLKTIDFQEIQ